MAPLLLLLIHLLRVPGLTVSGQEASEAVNPPAIAVAVAGPDLPPLAASTARAEAWARAHLPPSANASAVLVGDGATRCSGRHLPLLLPCALNLHYALLKLGLLAGTSVAVSVPDDCLRGPAFDRRHLAALRPLLAFLRDSRSTYSVRRAAALGVHLSALEELGFGGGSVRVAALETLGHRVSRRLMFASTFAPAPDASFSFVPVGSPPELPANSPFYPVAPPCAPMPVPPAAAPAHRARGALWCVAKPTVPAETLQEAMDYACGVGGAECAEIRPSGGCYYPDNVVAHASYAFNSYWQKWKRKGGSCGFGGTAILITSDPSYQNCRFVLS